MNLGFLRDLFNSIVKKKHKRLPYLKGFSHCTISDLLKRLMSPTGEISAIILAQEILDRYHNFNLDEKLTFFQLLESEYNSDVEAVRAAFAAYDANNSSQNLNVLFQATEPPRQELLRRINRAPNGTFKLVCMRADLLCLIKEHPALKAIDSDFTHLLDSWFNRGFLVMQSIDWSTPASILEKIILYEAVHEIKDWDELRLRLEPENRRCFAFFHPAMVDEPLIFLEVALTKGIPSKIDDILYPEPSTDVQANTATFYSISNCQDGLKNVSFGNFLIKQVVQELRTTLPHLKQFVTLSPIPTFYGWLQQSDQYDVINEALQQFSLINGESTHDSPLNEHEYMVKQLAAQYLVQTKHNKYPADPVARFHLGNGAKLHQIHTCADMSEKGYKQSLGVMVNYLYDLDLIEINHENYISNGLVSCSDTITRIIK